MLKKETLKLLFSVVLIVIVISCIIIYIQLKAKNKITENKLLDIANSIINSSLSENSENNQNIILNESPKESNVCEQQIFSKEKILNDNNVIGKIEIPILKINAPIQDGTSAEILKKSVGHFSKTKYWNGNVVLASHNRGTYAHYFEKINKLKIGDKIEYKTKLGTKEYWVNSINEISEDDLSVLNNTEENTMTLITCIKNKSNLRLCVRAIEKI